MSYIVFDTESVAMDGAADYIESATAPLNYKDPAAIARYIEQANAEQLAKAALDVDLARIIAIGVLSEGETEPIVMTMRDETDEREALRWFWTVANQKANVRPTLVGFNNLLYDLPLMLRRSLYLGIDTPKLPVNKYRHDGILDLMQALSFDGALKYRGLAFWKKRFALDVPADEFSGADIAGLVAANDWDAVTSHCRADILTTAALARRMGVL